MAQTAARVYSIEINATLAAGAASPLSAFSHTKNKCGKSPASIPSVEMRCTCRHSADVRTPNYQVQVF